ncbi:MAG: type VII secretion protein EssC [Clostridiales bacterium]|nr:MAG: type VII secretion protein EssC [Clostridiales bacterium]
MLSEYKIIISSRTLYKEIELPKTVNNLRVGTNTDCEVRLRKDLFFGDINLLFVNDGVNWLLYCSDNLFITPDDTIKLMSTKLKINEILKLKYQDSNNEVFSLEFTFNFDDSQNKYERQIDISNINKIKIGGLQDSDIIILNRLVKNDSIVIFKELNNYKLNIKYTTFGVFVNGEKVENEFEFKNGDFLSIYDYFFYFKDGIIFTDIRKDIEIQNLSFIDERIPEDYPKFNRNTRIKTVISDEKIEILDPPNKPDKPKNDLFLKLLPAFSMLLVSGMMMFMGRGPMMMLMSGSYAVIGIFTTLYTIRQSKKEYRKLVKEREEKYKKYIENKKIEIQECRKNEHEELEEIYVSQEVEKERLINFSYNLFDREKDDNDFLCIRFGSGDVESLREINYKKQEKLEIEDELCEIPEKIYNEYKVVHDSPVICNIKEHNAIAIVGDIKYRFEFLKNIVIDLISRQYISDIELVFISESKVYKDIEWLRFLPQVYNEKIGIRNIVCDDESKSIIFEYLYKELSFREENKTFDKNIIIFFYSEYGFKSHPISKFIDKAKDLGVTFIFFGDHKKDIPQGCGYVVNIKDDKNASLVNAENKIKTLDFVYPTLEMKLAEKIVNLITPVFTEEISLEGSLTKNITLFELLNIYSVEDLNLNERWAKSKVFESMLAPLGVSKTGLVSLDLHDKADGPHGLVAGTTGSGKSEILQSYILSVSTLFHPYDIAFLIIDFKGGGMVNQFKSLPHLVGAITNIDGKEINRSLKSIKAELRKRQQLFSNADVNHIDKYIKLYKQGKVDVPLPHLIIIVDEFAELKAEQPEFMKELISAARIGRSLGVHLILATQKPSGQVNEQIWSNSRFKLCLKVQSTQDSNEVIKSPLAAEIREPGRAYLQVGNNEVFELFQSAYSGAPENSDDNKLNEFSIYQLLKSGKKLAVYEQKNKNKAGAGKTQLESVVSYINEYCENSKVLKLPSICLPSLKEKIDFKIRDNHVEGSFYDVEIGIYDDPDNQLQDVYSVELLKNNLMIIGSAQTGKTNILQNIIRSLTTKYSPNEAVIYAIDFSSMILKNFDKLAHFGGVVCPSEDEKLKNLFKLLNEEIEYRKEKMISVGVSSFSSYKDAGIDDLPLIVLIVDNLTKLKELYFQEDDEQLLYLCREGLTVGISVVIANSQTSGIGYKYISNFSSKIALFCNDSSEYNVIFDHCRETIENIAGRTIVEIDKNKFECQAYLAFEGEKEIDRVNAIKAYISEINDKNRGMKAKRIPLIPEILTKEFVINEFSNYMQNEFFVVTGVDYETVSPYIINFASVGLMAISGRDNGAQYNWLKYNIDILDEVYKYKTKFYVLDSIEKRLSYVKDKNNVKEYSIIVEDATKYILEIEKEVKLRYEALVDGDEDVVNNSDLLVLVIDNIDAINAICDDVNSLNAYKNIVGRYKNMRVCILTFVENTNISYVAPDILKDIRDNHNIMFFDDLKNLKIFDLPLSIIRSHKNKIGDNDSFYIKDNEYIKLKICVEGDTNGLHNYKK